MFGGTLGATLVCFPLAQVRQLPAIARHALLPPALDRARAINLMVGFAQKARREGILVLEEDVAHADNPLLQLGVQLAVDGTPQDVMREILETEVEAMAERHKQGEALFSTMGGFAPTLGIIGTVMGLVHMLGTLNDPQGMGPAIASASLATLYGVALANLVLLPLAHKLRRRSDEEVVFSQMLVEGSSPFRVATARAPWRRRCVLSSPRFRRRARGCGSASRWSGGGGSGARYPRTRSAPLTQCGGCSPTPT